MPFNYYAPEPDRNFAGMLADIRGYTQEVLAHYDHVPNTREYVKAFLDDLANQLMILMRREKEGALRLSATTNPWGRLEQAVSRAVSVYGRIIPILRESYEIKDLGVPDDVKRQLEGWLMARGLGQGPRPAPEP